MRVLHHFSLSPFCRKVRVVLAEKRLDATLHFEKIWAAGDELRELNPAGQVPVLVEEAGLVLAESAAICEYLDEMYPGPCLMGKAPAERAETRRLVNWVDLHVFPEVTGTLLQQKLFKRLRGAGPPEAQPIRAAQRRVHHHMDYFTYLVERRNWMAGAEFGMADVAISAHLSSVDYFGDVPWDDHPAVKEWYARVKSRPSFRSLLGDRVDGLPPARHYADLDF